MGQRSQYSQATSELDVTHGPALYLYSEFDLSLRVFLVSPGGKSKAARLFLLDENNVVHHDSSSGTK
jgi:hypothetical protein